MVVDKVEGLQQFTAIVELFNPIYDVNENALKYDVTLVNATSIDLSSESGESTIVINQNRNTDP
ncbi:MAG: hypothetical protein ACPKPY_13730 [Nitrososphaeraceae archaeon]